MPGLMACRQQTRGGGVPFQKAVPRRFFVNINAINGPARLTRFKREYYNKDCDFIRHFAQRSVAYVPANLMPGKGYGN